MTFTRQKGNVVTDTQERLLKMKEGLDTHGTKRDQRDSPQTLRRNYTERRTGAGYDLDFVGGRTGSRSRKDHGSKAGQPLPQPGTPSALLQSV